MKKLIYRLNRLLQRLPFTTLTLAILILVGILTNSPIETLTRHWLNHLGFAPRDLWFFRIGRLLGSALVTSGGWSFWQALGMVALASGASEWMAGTRWTALTFWGIHFVTMFFEALLLSLPLSWTGIRHAAALFYTRDVGPSAGYFGCLGLASARLPKPWRWLLLGGIFLLLVVSLTMPPRPGQSLVLKMNDSIAHIIAFPLGVLSSAIFHKSTLNDHQDGGEIASVNTNKMQESHPLK